MNAHLPQRCVIALLASMVLALVIGLLGWGPVVLPSGPSSDPSPTLSTLPQVVTVAGALAMVAAGLSGLRRLDGHPQAVPWSVFFIGVALAGPASAWHQWAPDDWSRFTLQLCTAWISAALMCAFLAERVAPSWSRWPLLLASLVLATLSAGHWLVGAIAHGEGDLRSQMLLQWLPLLLAPAGALRLPGRVTTAGDWYVALTLYALALLAEAFGHRSPDPLAWAPAAAWLAYRAGRSAAAAGPADSAGEASKASTSLNTSG